MKSFRDFLEESIAAIAAANAVSANFKRAAKKPTPESSKMTPFKQGKADKASGKKYDNPHPFDPKSGADVNYDHNSYRDGYHLE